MIPRNVRLGEAPSHGMPVMLYDVKSRGAEAYLALAREVLRAPHRPRDGAPTDATGVRREVRRRARRTHEGDAETYRWKNVLLSAKA